MTKQGYADSLRELEKISEEIHERRKKRKQLSSKQLGVGQLGVREAGVGAECPPPRPKHEAEISKLKLMEQQSKKSQVFEWTNTKTPRD